MAIEKEQVLEILNGESELDVKAETLIEVFTKDFETEKTKILVNKEAIKNEKKEEIEKRHAVEAERDSLKKQISSLQEQVAASDPEGIRKIYEKDLEDERNVFNGQLKELQAQLDASNSRCKELEQVQHKMACMDQFNKAIVGKNVASDMVNDFAMFVLGPDCCKFAERSLGEGKTAIVTNEGQTIESAVKAALETTFGKACTQFMSSGGGAEGGTRTHSQGDKTISRSEFDSKSGYEKAELMKNGFRIV